MLRINTGKGSITAMTLIAVWSISLVVDLPGLAISPIMSQLDVIFPHASDLEIQLLSMLPNFCIFPFILLSGRLSMSRNRLLLINLGMAIFLAGGIACFFAKSMPALIIISCVIGVGCGLVIPLAAGVIAELFVGVQRVRQMGIKSGIANITLIFATLVVGWIGAKNWHLPFMVYLVPIIPLLLSPFLTDKYLKKTAVFTPEAPAEGTADKTVAANSTPAPNPVHVTELSARPDTPLAIARSSRANTVRCVWGIIIFYFVITVCTDTVTYYLPFVFQDDKMPDSYTSIVTSAFFLSITLAGFILPYVLKWLKNRLTFVCMTCMLAGLLLLAIFHNLVFTTAASLLLGFGYGLLQPVFYTKASLLSDNSFSATRTISYIMTANYLGTAVTPLIFTGIKDLFHISGPTFPFWFGLGLLAVLFIVSLIKSRSFVFYTSLKEA